MMILSSGMTNKEIFRINGSLPSERIESMLDMVESLETLSGIECDIHDGKQFPEEDFLTDVLEDMGLLLKSLRGDNRAKLQNIIEKLSSIEISTNNSTDYGMELLNKAEAAIEALCI